MKTQTAENSWVRKPDDEIITVKRQLRRSSLDLTMPFAVLIIVFLGIAYVFAKTGYPKTFTYAITFPIYSFFGTLVLQYINGRSFVGRDNFKICNSCQREDRLGNKTCSCGGTFEPFDFYSEVPKYTPPSIETIPNSRQVTKSKKHTALKIILGLAATFVGYFLVQTIRLGFDNAVDHILGLVMNPIVFFTIMILVVFISGILSALGTAIEYGYSSRKFKENLDEITKDK
jgi:uncharacterized membrane protein